MARWQLRVFPSLRGRDLRPVVLGAALVWALGLAITAAPAVGEPGVERSVPNAGRGQGASAAPDLRDLQGWLDQRAKHQVSMPIEARLAYRRGLIAWKSGQDAEGVILVRGASELDPAWTTPHFTLAWWFLPREASQSLLAWASLLQRLRSDFTLQLELLANAAFFGLHALFFGLLAAAIIIVGLHQHELRHAWRERLALVVSARSAGLWAWTFLLLPWTLNLGLTLPALVMLGMLWPVLKLRERLVFMPLAVLVAVAPLGASLMGRLALPLRDQAGPYYGVTALDQDTDYVTRHEQLTRLAAEHPDNPYLHFGLGWVARRIGDLAGAEASYRRTLQLWPANERVHNNLGNLLAMQGRFDEALRHYQSAVAVDPRSAPAYFNASQVHTRLFDYRAASDAVARASALDFEMVKAYQARSVGGDLPLVDQWIAPGTFWSTLLQAPANDVVPAVPPLWSRLIEISGWPMTLATLVLTVAGLLIGLWWQRRMPLRACSSCGRPVCRRCAQRMREVALCPDCATIAARAESNEFGRVLLGQQRRRVDQTRRIVRAAAAALVPGVGLLSRSRVFTAVGLLMATALLVTTWLDVRAPFALADDVRPGGIASGWALAACWVLVYAFSLLGAFRGSEPETQPVRVPQCGRSNRIDHSERAA